ncbi:MAG: hypothetical protein IPN95_17530 [Bacteroidetes bacterium]|nr:hypothetical protein [Bacteroidota bacterium]
MQLSLSGKESSSNLSLWDQLGRKVCDLGMGSTLARGNHQLTVDCSRIPNGTYHLDFSSKNSTFTKRSSSSIKHIDYETFAYLNRDLAVFSIVFNVKGICPANLHSRPPFCNSMEYPRLTQLGCHR